MKLAHHLLHALRDETVGPRRDTKCESIACPTKQMSLSALSFVRS